MSDHPDLVLADSLWPADLARLADIEARSRDAAPFAYRAAVADFERGARLIPDFLAAADHEAFRIAIRLYPDEVREDTVRKVLTRVALMGAVALSPESRMYLGRGWRKWREGLASS